LTASNCSPPRGAPVGTRRNLESGRLRVINTPMGQELIAELNGFEVDFTSAGSMRVVTCATAIW
jgi:hypothetical protein